MSLWARELCSPAPLLRIPSAPQLKIKGVNYETDGDSHLSTSAEGLEP
jgi:hypothetical protein